jgi:hypothetical protein
MDIALRPWSACPMTGGEESEQDVTREFAAMRLSERSTNQSQPPKVTQDKARQGSGDGQSQQQQ